MARRPKGQINKKNRYTLKVLTDLMEALDQKYSIKVGIIGEAAAKKHKDSGLTNAELGAVHEFGCTINVTPKMRAFLHSIDIHLKPETNTVVIPTRSFLRMPLLSGEFKEYLIEHIGLYESSGFGRGKEAQQEAREGNLELALAKIEENPNIMEDIAKWIGVAALTRVQDAFESGGWGKWAPISEVTKENRIKDKTSPPLTDTSELRNSITAEVQRVK